MHRIEENEVLFHAATNQIFAARKIDNIKEMQRGSVVGGDECGKYENYTTKLTDSFKRITLSGNTIRPHTIISVPGSKHVLHRG